MINKKEVLLDTARTAFEYGLFAGTSGNLSYCDREQNKVIITPSSVRYNTMQLEDLVVLDMDGNVLEGYNKPSSEWKMHLEVYRKREDINSVFHTHSPYATSFAVLKEEVPLILIEMIPFLGGNIRVAEISMPGSVEMGENALKVLTDRNVCLLANHGVLTIGKTIKESFLRAEYTEDAAKIYHYARAVGTVNLVPKDMSEIMFSRIASKK